MPACGWGTPSVIPLQNCGERRLDRRCQVNCIATYTCTDNLSVHCGSRICDVRSTHGFTCQTLDLQCASSSCSWLLPRADCSRAAMGAAGRNGAAWSTAAWGSYRRLEGSLPAGWVQPLLPVIVVSASRAALWWDASRKTAGPTTPNRCSRWCPRTAGGKG